LKHTLNPAIAAFKKNDIPELRDIKNILQGYQKYTVFRD
jgi:hypothetical protein